MRTRRITSPHELRLKAAVGAGRLAAMASRLAGRGAGKSIKGRVITTLAPTALADLLADRTNLVVTGTNGKTTTTHLLTAALRAAHPGAVVTNADGANLRHGIVSSISEQPAASVAVLETDERVVADVIRLGRPLALVILNLSRDQLDRHHEITSLARDWRETLAAVGEAGPVVVATTDDPLVVWAAEGAARRIWVDANGTWTQDAALCPVCGEVLVRQDAFPHWSCPGCGLAQPAPDYVATGPTIAGPDGSWTPRLQVPGQFNVGNAACALAAARVAGVDPAAAVAAMEGVKAPAGRFSEITLGATTARLLLAKNPAGWATVLPLATAQTVVLAIDSQYADGQDVSWLWDVDFEVLAGSGQRVIATGYRGRDLDVRLAYAGVDREYVPNLADAVGHRREPFDIVATYTPFQLLKKMGGLR